MKINQAEEYYEEDAEVQKVRPMRTRQRIWETRYSLIRKVGKQAVLWDWDTDDQELWSEDNVTAGRLIVIDGIDHRYVRKLKKEERIWR